MTASGARTRIAKMTHVRTPSDPGTMRTTLLLVAALALVAFTPTIAAADPNPCPTNCWEPEPCGWGPDMRKDPDGWADFMVDCATDLLPR